ncbi:hypothetical protein SETIT_7G223600v2 [Setaria italica]|uniref:Uncharacterized protein n=1 Tax=Setaria italica TaxID=4555 RepID=A0A368RYJ9_SETIT|nr:uncharacterized protein LOC101768464 isoform X2 [Setaria italica]RCV35225.1 hypothetical protein SETIT_7G223600v2 [Setaria italica]
MYNLHLQHQAVTLHPSRLQARVTAPHRQAKLPRRRRFAPPLLLHAESSRFACVPRASATGSPRPDPGEGEPGRNGGFWTKWMVGSAEARARVAKLGLAAVLAYGLFDAVTYTTFFVLAFLGYEKSTGKNPAANLKALLGIVILMWTGNNVTRPFRVAGATALAPVIDKGLKGVQEKLNLPTQMYAFALVIGSVATQEHLE